MTQMYTGGYGYPAPPTPRNGMGLSALIVGLAGVLLGLVPLTGWLAIICAFVAIPLGLVGFSRTRKGQATNKKTALSGVIAGLLALALGIWGMTLFFNSLNQLSSDLENLGGSDITIPESLPTAQPIPYVAPTQAASATVQPQTFEGSGDDVISVNITDPAILTFECPACSRNTIVKTNNDLLVNRIGAYQGKHLINARSFESATTQIQVNARGSWKLSIGGLDTATAVSEGAPVSGKGDAVVVLKSATTKAALTHRGDRNFIVQVFTADGRQDLAVNDIGAYDGKVIMNGPAVVNITADGDWTLTPE